MPMSWGVGGEGGGGGGGELEGRRREQIKYSNIAVLKKFKNQMLLSKTMTIESNSNM